MFVSVVDSELDRFDIGLGRAIMDPEARLTERTPLGFAMGAASCEESSPEALASTTQTQPSAAVNSRVETLSCPQPLDTAPIEAE